MSIAQSLLPEFDMEMANTRKTLERVPEDRFSYQPDPKSMTMGRLAAHVAEMPGWGSITMNMDSLDLAGNFTPFNPTNRAELLAGFDKNIAETRAAIAAASDEAFMQPWSLKMGDQVLFTMPRVAVIRSMVMNHVIHHRAQLTVYFRLNGVPVPGLYGPSADEPMAATA
jgi:uncharacterized damage-inducible protein DinB